MKSLALQSFEAYELVQGRPECAVFLICEHASARLPLPWRWSPSQSWLAQTHWAVDLGARDIVLEWCAAMHASAVLARFSRLLVDANRCEDAPDLFRSIAEGQEVELNRRLDEDDKRRRLDDYYHPYHEAIDVQLAMHTAPLVLSVHSFTPVYEGQPRDVQIGVLFDEESTLAEEFAASLEKHLEVPVSLNEPYSGRGGFMHSAQTHATRFQRQALEIEVRQDLAAQPDFRARLIKALCRFW